MLVLASDLVDELVAHAREQHPIEACGIIAGPAGTDRPTRLIRMRNALGSEVAFQFDAAEQLALYRQMDARGEDPIVIYHSHTASAAIPSGTDTRCALDPDAHYLIISTRQAHTTFRSWRRLAAGPRDWNREPIQIRDSEDQPHSSA